MADKIIKTTSSISLDTTMENMTKASTSPMPNKGEAQMMTRLAENITESYTKANKQRQQQKLNDLTNQIKQRTNESSTTKLYKSALKSPLEEWQEVCSSKNKLKRKKTLSASLTSVTDSVNQEKRTRIEGMQLNCRGRLNVKENINTATTSKTSTTPSTANPPSTAALKTEKLTSKPPLPPSSRHNSTESLTPKVVATPPPRLKRKLQENVQTIQKLNALTEQLRLEINELKSSLTTEKGAVRVLRAQNEAEARKWKTEVKKLQVAVEFLKKSGITKKCDTAITANADNLPHAAVGGLVNYEIQRLTNEINSLKEANKALEEKKVINCDADRRKAADIRELKDSYEIRLTQIQKSAKNEISRLLEEIKTKERNIGQLKKDLQILQNSTTKTSRNATTLNTNNNNNLTNKTTTLNLNTKNQILKKSPKNVNNIAATNKLQQQQKPEESSTSNIKETSKELTTNHKDLTKIAENSNEISKLKNIELINNTKNVTTTNLHKSTKILNTLQKPQQQNYTNNNENINKQNINEDDGNDDVDNTIITTSSIHQHLKALEIPHIQNDNCLKHQQQQQHYTSLLTTTIPLTATAATDNTSSSINPLINMTVATPPKTTTSTTTQTCDELDHFDEQHITQELTQHLQNKAIQDAKQKQNLHHHNHHHHLNNRHHHLHNSSNSNNHHSDSDSALSSAPTSISPQPPANGVEPTDLWQTMRSYTNDIEKLQKEVDLLHKQNGNLQKELNVAKDQIIELETNAMESSKNSKIPQLMERIKYLEDQELELQAEANDLRGQEHTKNSKIPQLMERIKYLEDQEHELQAEANDLREQNELLEFRILELEETNDKWSLQSNTNPTSESSESLQTATLNNSTQNVWNCAGAAAAGTANNKPDPFEMLFGSNSHTSQQNTSIQLDSGIISPQSPLHHDDLIDISNGELCRRLGDLLKKATLEDEEKHCLQQVLNLVQQLDALTPQSGPNSLNATSSSDEASSLDLVKSRISDYSSASSSASSARLPYDNSATSTKSSISSNSAPTSRIVATVQPYNSIPPYTPSNSQHLAPHNTPTDSPRKVRSHPWQTTSLSESGVFVESDFFSDASENNVCTQTDFDDSDISQNSSYIFNSPIKKVPVQQKNSANLSDQKRLQYYKDRLEVLEGKVLIYESSGDVQAKRLAERLQREILLEKEVNELRDRVEFLESENSTLEEEKCEFEEAENDTRLRLQRLEVELEILSQRNIELEMSREALVAKYKDCHSECLILRDDLATTETQIRHLEEDKQKAKENFEFLHSTLPLLLICNTYCTLAQTQNQTQLSAENEEMGNQISQMNIPTSPIHFPGGSDTKKTSEVCTCQEKELLHLKEEVKCLRHQIKELNTRHYAAMESADSHWVDLERDYKEREEHFRAKEMSLKQKIQKLQDCLREDARSANEKICQLEEAEQGLKTCLVKVSKEYQKLQEDHQLMQGEFERFKELHDQIREQQRPLQETLETEKKRNKGLIDELTFMRKLQQETENHGKNELDSVRTQIFDLKKDYLHIEVTNGELREEVATLELQIQSLEKLQRESEEKIRCLTDEIRTKDEICQRLEKRLERSEGYSLADELGDSPSKRFKREDVKDLKTASKGLGQALRHMGDCERMLPSQKQFKTIARDVKKLADTLLQDNAAQQEEVSLTNQGRKSYSKIEKPQNETKDENDTNNSETEIEQEKDIVKQESLTFEPLLNSTKINEDSMGISQFNPDPKTSSTPLRQSLEDSSQEVVEIKQEYPEVDLTVNMAIFPQIRIDPKWLPSGFHKQNKVISEVPSELRKLSIIPQSLSEKQEIPSLNRDYKKRNRHYVKRRMCRGRLSNLNVRVKRLISRFNAHHSPPIIFQDVSDLDFYDSEILQRNTSYGSFQSLAEEISENLQESTNPSIGIDVGTMCEIKLDTKDIATETLPLKHDSSIQVNMEDDEEFPESTLPKYIIEFLSNLKASVSHTDLHTYSSIFNLKIRQLWETDLEFRHGLEILANFSANIANDSSNFSFENYEDFVKAFSTLEELYKPYKIPLLLQIDEKLNEHLMNFHNRKMESEFYCTVYYPIKRESALDFTNLLAR